MRRSFLAQPEYDDPLEPAFGRDGGRRPRLRFELDANNTGRMVPPERPSKASMALFLSVYAFNVLSLFLSSSLA